MEKSRFDFLEKRTIESKNERLQTWERIKNEYPDIADHLLKIKQYFGATDATKIEVIATKEVILDVGKFAPAKSLAVVIDKPKRFYK